MKLAPLKVSSLYKLQTYQKKHDQEYHADIAILPHPRQLTHFALHFSKYSGRLTKRGQCDGYSLQQTLKDIFIITLSASNLLNIDLGVAIENADFSVSLVGLDMVNVSSWLSEELAYYGGLISKACESLDHMEKLDYKQIAKQAVTNIACAVLYAISLIQQDFNIYVIDRWQEIELKQIL